MTNQIRTYIAHIEGTAPYRCGKPHDTEKLPGESHADYDKRTYKERAHVDDKGFILIPAQAFKGAIDDAARAAGDKITGKGSSTWGKIVVGSTMIVTPLNTGTKIKDAPYVDVYCHSDGKKGGTAGRVWRRFPEVPPGWKGTLEIVCLDPSLPEDHLKKYISNAGLFGGVGTWRPKNGGGNGRFKLIKLDRVND